MKAKEDWMDNQCKEIDVCLNKNNSKKAYQLVKDLTSEKQGRSTTIQDKSGKCLTEEQEILSRWAEYCSELYNYESYGDNTVLGCSQHPEEDLQLILHEKLRSQLLHWKRESLQELIIYQQNLFQHAGSQSMIDVLTKISNKIWKTGEWPTPWTQSLIITLPKKATYSSARITEPLASSVIQVKSCWESSWRGSNPKLTRLLLKNRLCS